MLRDLGFALGIGLCLYATLYCCNLQDARIVAIHDLRKRVAALETLAGIKAKEETPIA